MCLGLFFPSMPDLFRKKLFLFHEINPDCIHQILMKKDIEDDQFPIEKEEDDLSGLLRRRRMVKCSSR